MSNRSLHITTLVPQTQDQELVRDRLQNTTFVGIDFGTSTTVASYAVPGDKEQPIRAEPIPVPQTLPDGATHEQHLVSSVIAWHNERLLIGAGARQLKNHGRVTEGNSAWSSFKMDLGVDLGPQYHNSKLRRDHPVATIETPRDAATVFLRYMREHIEAFVEAKGLPTDIQYAISIPAAFEPNQREDLMRALRDAGIDLPEQAFIDEPNAAFLNFLTEANMFGETKPLQIPSAKPLQVLVFDFGAGTCDISILEVGDGPDGFYSKNLAISRFEVLGGDNIDRQLVREVLLNQICEQSGITPNDLRQADIEKRVIPVLKSVAEQLKIAACKRVSSEMPGTRLPELATDPAESLNPTTNVEVSLPRQTLEADHFTLTYADFHDVMAPFLDPEGASSDTDDVISIFQPIRSAIQKARLEASELDLVLLVGGSSKNPYVQAALHDYFGEQAVEVEVPRDLRSHVSTGAAINSLVVNGLRTSLIKPIISESIFAIVRNAAGQSLRTLVPASTEIPAPPTTIDDLRVGRDGQQSVHIPICVGTRNKIVATLEVKAPSASGFERGTEVHLDLQLTRDKLLQVQATVGSQTVQTEIARPFANSDLTPEKRRVLEAERAANTALATRGGRTTMKKLLELAKVCSEVGEHIRAAEILEQLQMINAGLQRETSIACEYEQGGRNDLALKWAKKAYDRNENAVTARNVAVTAWNQNRDRETYTEYLEKSLEMNGSYVPTLMSLGTHLRGKDDERSHELIERAFDILQEKRQYSDLRESQLRSLKQAATILGHDEVADEVKAKLDERDSVSDTRRGEYDTDSLAARFAPDALSP